MNGQNLLANGDFEELNMCSEFNVPCAPEAWFRCPALDLDLYFNDVDLVYEGKNAEVIIVENRKFPLDLRLHLYSMLLCPLEAGAEYILSFYINPIYDRDYKLDIEFTTNEIKYKDYSLGDQKSDITIRHDGTYIRRNKWIYKEAKFIADGDEVFINFGNFSPEPYEMKKEYIPRGFGNEIVYLIDNVRLIKSSPSNSIDCDINFRKDILYKTDSRHNYDSGLFLQPVSEEVTAPNDKDITITVPDFAFASNQYEIKEEYFSILDEMIVRLNGSNIKHVKIIGHTDDIGESDYNQKLSVKRANSIYAYLDRSTEIVFEVIGRGEDAPLVSNSTEENRKLNRRVEIIFKNTNN